MTTFFSMRFLWILLSIKALFLAFLIYSGAIGLGPDEAQYWTWSQQLDFGYYSKPPGIAWQIALGTHLYGNNEFGVRFFSLVIGFLLPLAVYKLARTCHLQPETSFWAAVVMAFSPLGMMASVLAITDGGNVLFWTLAMIVACHSLTYQKPLAYYLIGFLILCGSLFKWPMYFFWGVIISLEIWRRTFSWHLIGGILLSLLGLLPAFIWNAQRDFPTFRHVFSTVYGKETVDVGTTTLIKGNFLEFIGAQSLLFSPILFICLILAFMALFRTRHSIESQSLRFCGASTFAILLIYAGYSCFKKMQGNWCDFIYPSACILIAWFACESNKKAFPWLKIGVTSSITMIALLFVFPQPFKHNLGWTTLQETLVDLNYNPSKQFLFGDKYQTSSLLSFYGPEQKRAYFFNLQGMRQNQFSYWPGMEEEQIGKDGLFVVTERNGSRVENQSLVARYEKTLSSYFSKVQFLGMYPLVVWRGNSLKNAYIFNCLEYNGELPHNSTTY